MFPSMIWTKYNMLQYICRLWDYNLSHYLYSEVNAVSDWEAPSLTRLNKISKLVCVQVDEYEQHAYVSKINVAENDFNTLFSPVVKECIHICLNLACEGFQVSIRYF